MQNFKTFFMENSKVKGEDYEAAIVMGWNEINSLNESSDGISSSVKDLINKTPKVKQSGYNIAKEVLSKFPSLKGKMAQQYGRESNSTTSFWKEYGATDKTPKTDILIGDARFSVKIGIAQLMSGGKEESLATFYAAAEQSGITKSEEFKLVEELLQKFVKSTLAPGKIGAIIKKGNNDIVNEGDAAHKEIMQALGTLFEKNNDFKIAFAREAMSGISKFGKSSKSAAEFILAANHEGTSTNIHNINDDSYCAVVAEKMKLSARFKSASRKLDNKKTGEYRFWSVVSLIVDATKIPNNVNEGLFDGAIAKIKNVVGNIKSFFNKSLKEFFNFMSLEKEDIYINFNKEIKF